MIGALILGGVGVLGLVLGFFYVMVITDPWYAGDLWRGLRREFLNLLKILGGVLYVAGCVVMIIAAGARLE